MKYSCILTPASSSRSSGGPGFIRRAIARLLRQPSPDQFARRNRAQRLFEVNFRNPCSR